MAKKKQKQKSNRQDRADLISQGNRTNPKVKQALEQLRKENAKRQEPDHGDPSD